MSRLKGFKHSEETKKKIGIKNTISLKGKSPSLETRMKLSNSHKGKIAWNKGLHFSDEYKYKMSLIKKGKKIKSHTEEHKRKISEALKNIPLSVETKRKMSLAQGGTGITGENSEYGSEFDSSLKERVRFRDGYKCRVCGCSQIENGKQLDCHHIDYNKKNNNENNLISLCRICHSRTNHRRNYWLEYFNQNGLRCE